MKLCASPSVCDRRYVIQTLESSSTILKKKINGFVEVSSIMLEVCSSVKVHVIDKRPVQVARASTISFTSFRKVVSLSALKMRKLTLKLTGYS